MKMLDINSVLMVFIPTGKGKKGCSSEKVKVVKAMLSEMGFGELVTHYTNCHYYNPKGWHVAVFGLIVAIEVEELEHKQNVLMDLGFVVINSSRSIMNPQDLQLKET